jgi:phosphoribosylaminoimidazole carboxylase PurE protein
MAAKVAILMGSKSDLKKINSAFDTLEELGVEYEARVMSAHRTPSAVAEFVEAAEENGIGVIIAAAGCAAHLAGAVAAHTVLPVIGLPVEGGALNGLDALLSTVQMPGGIPVATVAVGGGGPKNAAILAAQILATADDELKIKLKNQRKTQQVKVADADRELQKELAK